MKYRYVIWDWNGTLLDDAGLCVDVMNGILRKKNLPELTPARYRSIFDFPVSVYYDRLGFDYDDESFEVLGTRFIEGYEAGKHRCSLREHAAGLLDRLHRAGIRQAILSAYHHDALTSLLASMQLDHYFDWIMGAEDHYARGKEAQGRYLIDRIRPAPGTAVLIGDTCHDHEVAEAIGADCILIPGGHQSETRLRACGCRVAADLREVESRLTE